MRRHVSSKRSVVVAAAIVLFIAAPVVTAQVSFEEDAGTLPDGTSYRMRLPGNWNGILISDLDYAATPRLRDARQPAVGANRVGADNERNMLFLERGYGVAGIARHPRRDYEYDPVREIANLVTVTDMFEAKWGAADRIIQYGHSGGGYVALAMAETRPDKIHGAVAGCAHVPIWLANTSTDYWFVLQTLLAPELTIADVPADTMELAAAWREAIETAQQTPLGRARIALAATVGQLPTWPGGDSPKPDPNDIASLQNGMYEVIVNMSPGGAGRFMFEQAGGGQPASNVGTDYKALFDNGEDANKRAVRELYRQAGWNLDDDLQRVNAAPRITADQSALDWWVAGPGRTVTGTPRVPVFRIHTFSDPAVPVSLVAGYNAKVRETKGEALYRSAIVDAVGHCAFNAGESMAAVETLLNRIDTGQWHDTDPAQLNRKGDSYGHGTSRYVQFSQRPYNHAWFPNEAAEAY